MGASGYHLPCAGLLVLSYANYPWQNGIGMASKKTCKNESSSSSSFLQVLLFIGYP